MPVQLPYKPYTSRDFDTTVAFLRDYVSSTNPEQWSDFFESNIGQNIIDMIAIQSDVLSYVANQISREMFLPTAQRYASGLKHAKLVGYPVRGRTAASITLQAKTPFPAAMASTDVRFPAATQMELGDLTFELPEQVIIPAGTGAFSLTLSNSVADEDTFVSDGTAFQKFTTDGTPVLNASWKVTVNGLEWTQVNSLLIARATYSYSAQINSNGQLEISFGDGVSGLIPTSGATIKIKYRTGGGVDGNVPANSANGSQLVGFIGAQQYSFTFNNSSKATGGAEEESLEELKYNIPAWVRTVDKAITKEDYDTLARTFEDSTYGAVARAVAKLRYEPPVPSPLSGPYGNYVDVFIWAYSADDSFEPASQGLREAVYRYLHSKRIVTVQVCVTNGGLVPTDIDLGTILIDERFGVDAVSADVEAAVKNYFLSAAFQPGQSLRVSDLYSAVEAVEGVDHFQIVSPASDVHVMDTELIIRGNITFTIAYPEDVPATVGPCPD
jgi:hypothetical protein